MDGRGYSAEDWAYAKVFQDRVATPHDVDQGAAVFALGDTLNGRCIDLILPQPVIWYDEDDEIAALVVQAEAHETEDGETLEVMGLLLPDGHTRVAFYEDLEAVEGSDATWVSLIGAEREEVEADEDDDDGEDWLAEGEEPEEEDFRA
jgi:hypothetical protein